jgi:hypothetical protein
MTELRPGTVRHRRALIRSVVLPLAAAAFAASAAGCGELPEDGVYEDEESLEADNGLRTINGLRARNGLASGSGLDIGSGLRTLAGLGNGSDLMSTADGRATVSYLVRCALPAGRSITKKDQNGISYTYPGLIGLAPAWENGSCNADCQEWVSACMLALVNTTGKNYPLWVVAQHAAIGWSLDPESPYQEGSFFGNIFASPPSAYYCEGRDFGRNPIPGRIGGNQTSPPYVNRYSDGTRCSRYCAAADHPNQGDGFKSCSGWNRVLTVWHQ